MRKFLSSKQLLSLSFICFIVLFNTSLHAQTIVSPANTGVNWFTAETQGDGAVTFVSGPGNPPLGCGSLQMSLSTYTSKAQYLTSNYIGTPLSNITAISYWAYRSSTSTNFATQTISLNIHVDVNGAAPGGLTTLVYEPLYQSGTVMNDTWQLWDAYNGGNAIWWSTQAIPGVCQEVVSLHGIPYSLPILMQ